MMENIKDTIESKYLEAKKCYQEKCLEFIVKLKNDCDTASPTVLEKIEDSYGREAMERDDLCAEDIFEMGVSQLAKCEVALTRSIEHPSSVKNLADLRKDWQYNVHALDNQLANSTQFLGGLSPAEKDELKPLQQSHSPGRG